MKKNYFLLILSLILSFPLLGQNSQVNHKRHHSFLKTKNDRKFNKTNKLSHFHTKKKQINLKSSQDIKKQRLDSVIQEDWDEITSQWQIDYKDEFTYDVNENLTQYLEYYWEQDTNHWSLGYKEEYTYNTNGGLVLWLQYEGWNTSTSQWGYSGKKEYTYDNNENLTQMLDYYLDSNTNQWSLEGKEEYTYDINGNLTEILYYQWDYSTYPLNLNYKEEYTYDNSGYLTEVLEYYWDQNTNQWQIDYKDEYTYDDNENLIRYQVYYWDQNTNQWEIDFKEEYIYENNGNLIESLYYEWDQYTNQLSLKYKFEDTYDNTYSFSDLIIPFLYTEDNFGGKYFNHMLISSMIYKFDETSNEFVKEEKWNFYYSEQTILSVSEINDSEFNIYPNPVINTLTINSKLPITKVGIYSILGQKVKEIDANFNSISTHDLSNGIYLLRIESENGNAIKKLVKQ